MESKLKRGWFIFTADNTYFTRENKKNAGSEPPQMTGETARIRWSGKKWPKLLIPKSSEPVASVEEPR